MQPRIKERYLAIVLLDLIGSTAFVQKVGAVKAAEWLQYHDRLTRSLMYRFNGREIDRSDGFLVSFEEPINAVNFSLHYQKTIPLRTRLNTRIGVHYGKVAEVTQHELDVMVGAKPVELEGIAKNIAARTMSVCRAGQVLLTEEAFTMIKGRTNSFTPKGTRYVMVGLYKFKGVRAPQVIYAVGSSIESLQPPPSSEKVKRLGGPKKVKSRARDRKLKEWVWWVLPRWAFVNLIYIISLMWPWLMYHYPILRALWSWINGR
jgi:class 3 adenylate cyclase